MAKFNHDATLKRFQEKCSEQDPITGCINWTGARRNEGYGIFGFSW